MSRISEEKMGNATSILNHLGVTVTAGNPQTLRLLQGMRANFVAHGADGVTEALGAVYGMLQQHAAMLPFVEAFFVKGVRWLSSRRRSHRVGKARWSTMRTRKSTISFCTDRRHGFKAKFPLILRAQLGEIANPRLW
jgi:hypothetical protein